MFKIGFAGAGTIRSLSVISFFTAHSMIRYQVPIAFPLSHKRFTDQFISPHGRFFKTFRQQIVRIALLLMPADKCIGANTVQFNMDILVYTYQIQLYAFGESSCPRFRHSYHFCRSSQFETNPVLSNRLQASLWFSLDLYGYD